MAGCARRGLLACACAAAPAPAGRQILGLHAIDRLDAYSLLSWAGWPSSFEACLLCFFFAGSPLL
jgi:hypothetical protein